MKHHREGPKAIEYLAKALAAECGYVQPDAAIFFLIDQISKRRGLRAWETELLYAANRRQRGKVKLPWTAKDDEMVRQLHPTVPQVERGWAEIGEQLEPPRSPFAVKKRIFEMGLRTGRARSSQAREGAEG